MTLTLQYLTYYITMHLEKRNVGKKTKYYLGHSFREGPKVHKIRKFLGVDLNKMLLDKRISKAKELILEEIDRYNVIKDPLQFKLSKKDIAFVKKLEKEIPLKISHLSEQQWTQFSELFIRQFLHTTIVPN